MVEKYNVDGVHPPRGWFSQVAEIGPGARLFFIAGQTGVRQDGETPAGVDAQIAQVSRNIGSILAARGLGFENLVWVTIYLTDTAHIEIWRAASRDFFAGATPPPSSLLVVKSLARPEMLVEVEAVAAQT